jgi:catechol 2,3-dioxygenase-like lactoylglutathione lyase family enzyme
MKIRHVGINVKHLPRAIRFYEKLGFIVDSGSIETWAGNELHIVKMRTDGDCLLELVRGVWQPHFALTIDTPLPQNTFMRKEYMKIEAGFIKDLDNNIIELVREK